MLIEAVVSVLRYSAPIGLAALGETIGQKSGVINIGLEGTMITAAYTGMVLTQVSGSPWIGLVGAVVVGVLLSLFQAIFTLKLAADQVVVGTAINLLGLGLTGTLYRMRYGNSGQLLSVPKIPVFGLGLDLVLVFWVLAVGILGWMLMKSSWGLVLRGTGEYPQAVRASGFSVLRVRSYGTLIGGGFAGLAGAYLSLGIAGSFAENMTAGRGFVALAMVTFGRWRPGWVFLASLLIGYADSLQFELQARNIGLPPQLFIALPYVLALVVLIVVGKGSAAPADLARPYSSE